MAGERMQASFAMGEVAPEFHGRVDLELFRQALKTCKNFIVNKLGSLYNRSGMRHVRLVGSPGQAVLIPFKFSKDQEYVLVLNQETGEQSSITVFSGGELLTEVTECPWVYEDFRELRWFQIRDILFIVHPRYRPMELQRSDHTDWALVPFSTERDVYPPTLTAGTKFPITENAVDVFTDREWEWVVTSVNKDGQESLPSSPLQGATPAVTFNSASDPAQITITASVVGDVPDSYNVY